jgi:hypothetical protein
VPLRISINIFSGRPDPVLELSGKDAKDALDRLRPARPLTKSEALIPLEPRLGYRGLLVEQVGAPVRGLPKFFRVFDGRLQGQRLSHRASDEDFEDFIAQRAGRLKVGKDFPEYLRREMVRARRDLVGLLHWKHPRHPNKHHCRCAPLYEPQWWNDGWWGQKQPHNNCYNYGTNYRTDTFAQPGLAAGAQYSYPPTCANVRPAAVADSLIDTPSANNKCPKEGHLVALVISPGFDYHWYRKGRAGYWTHKMGNSPATDVDNSGNLIPDPRTANRGSYTIFCTFMVVMHGHTLMR